MSEIKKCYIAFATHKRDADAIMADIEAASAVIREKGMEPVFELRKRVTKPKDKAEALIRAAARLKKLAECEAVYFCKGYRSSRFCKLFELAAFLYNLNRLYAEPLKQAKKKEGIR